MTDILIPGFDIALTAASGQCFRFSRIGDTRFRVIASGRRLEIEDLGAHLFRPARIDARQRLHLPVNVLRLRGKASTQQPVPLETPADVRRAGKSRLTDLTEVRLQLLEPRDSVGRLRIR